MVSKSSIKGQLRSIGHGFRLFGRAEIKELKNILQPGERIVQYTYGYYHGGSGLLVATDKRLILIDKRPFFMNVESMLYSQVNDIDFDTQMLFGSLYLHAGIKKIVFRSVSDADLRTICDFTKDKIESIEKPVFAKVLPMAQIGKRPYLNPAWRPHHLTIMPKQRASKFRHDPTRPVIG
jgi:hypothetical protein